VAAVTDLRATRRRVLVLGDDPRLPRLVDLALAPARFEVATASSADELLERVAHEPPSLVALDLRAAGVDGVALCERLHELVDVPVIFLAAADDDASKVRALRCGDDYLSRPFSPAELRARAEAVLRRAHPCLDVRAPVYDDGYLVLDFGRHTVTAGGRDAALTPTEYRLLTLLARNRGRLFLHDELLERVFGAEYRGDSHLLRLHVANLRKKIEPDPAHPRYLRTHRGLGYAFAPTRAGLDES
jgi:two-component system KDP operon response regulator KdpE